MIMKEIYINIDEVYINLTNIKKNIYMNFNIYQEEQIWYNGDTLIDDDYTEWNESNIYSILVDNKWFTFNVHTLSGNTILINYIKGRDYIYTIKNSIYDKLKIQSNKYKLYLDNIQLLENDLIIQHFNYNDSKKKINLHMIFI